ncbi:MAG: pyridoxamine 5'-phosphate oxidase family protein [Ardenticatenia bacterium]|nr:pyridoxamine 5'-phosphate oxidase family protein [Ardenticatenia bacterium]
MIVSDERLLEFLHAHRVLTLAVVEPGGTPYAAALFYAVEIDPLRFYVLTSVTTRHGQALRHSARVAGTIQRDRQTWTSIRGVQFTGVCHRLDGDERSRAWHVYTSRFTFLRRPPPVLARALLRVDLWSIEPHWVRLIDNRLGFGHKDEWGE